MDSNIATVCSIYTYRATTVVCFSCNSTELQTLYVGLPLQLKFNPTLFIAREQSTVNYHLCVYVCVFSIALRERALRHTHTHHPLLDASIQYFGLSFAIFLHYHHNNARSHANNSIISMHIYKYYHTKLPYISFNTLLLVFRFFWLTIFLLSFSFWAVNNKCCTVF